MTNNGQKQEFGQRSVDEFRVKLLADLPAVERWVATIRELCAQKPSAAIASLCTSCAKWEKCEELCEAVKSQLPRPYGGKIHGETTTGVNFDEVRTQKAAPGQEDGDEAARKKDHGTFRDFRKVESFDAMESYKACWHLLSHQQQEAVRLYHAEGKGNGEIAVLLDKKPSTISGLLKRAKIKKEEHDAEMRRQELKLQRELEAKSDEI